MGTQLLTDMLRRDKRFDIIEVCGGPESITAAPIEIAVLFCDPNTPEKFGFVRQIKMMRSELKVIALMDDPCPAAVLEAFRAGVRGIFCRSDSYKTLAKCIVRVRCGHIWATQAQLNLLVQAIGEPFPMTLVDARQAALLSRREETVVYWVTEGLTNREIADRMQLSEHTIKNYLFHIFDKLGVSSRAELVLYALNNVSIRSVTPRRRQDCALAMLGGENSCELEACPLARLETEGVSGCELEYLQLVMAEAVSSMIQQRSRAALLELERRIPVHRLTELRKCADKRSRRALEVITQNDAGSRTPLSDRMT